MHPVPFGGHFFRHLDRFIPCHMIRRIFNPEQIENFLVVMKADDAHLLRNADQPALLVPRSHLGQYRRIDLAQINAVIFHHVVQGINHFEFFKRLLARKSKHDIRNDLRSVELLHVFYRTVPIDMLHLDMRQLFLHIISNAGIKVIFAPRRGYKQFNRILRKRLHGRLLLGLRLLFRLRLRLRLGHGFLRRTAGASGDP